MSKSNRVGLSEYTARRLAELRARRAEADDTGSFSTSTSVLPDANANILSTIGSTENQPTVTTSHSTKVTSSQPALPITEPPLMETNGNKKNDLDSTRSAILDLPAQQPNDNYAFRPPSIDNTDRAVAPRTVVGSSALPSDRAMSATTAEFSRQTLPTSYARMSSDSKRTDASNGAQSSAVTVDSDQFQSSSLFDGNDRGVLPRPSASGVYSYDSSRRSSSSSVASASGTTKKPDVSIGFSNLPEQLHRKAVKKGFDFTIMVVGESGLGKSTLVSNLFCKYDLYKDRKSPEPSTMKTMQIEKRYLEIEDHGIKLRLTVVDTPGFADTINSSQCLKPIGEYIQQQFEQFFRDETGLNRHNIKDTRVHCCLYFISPYGRGLRQIDIQLMHYLQNVVNIVPVIAKADTLTVAEMQRFKAQVLSEIKKFNLKVYQLPPCDEDEDDDFRARDKDMKDAWPFAVIGANSLVEVNGRRVRGRVYPWGVIEADNPKHSDFLKLQQFLISTHLHDLKEVTCDVHYENFRVHRIQQQGSTSTLGSSASLSSNGQADDDTETLLRQKEEEIRRMQQMMKEMQSQMMRGQQQQHVNNGPS